MYSVNIVSTGSTGGGQLVTPHGFEQGRQRSGASHYYRSRLCMWRKTIFACGWSDHMREIICKDDDLCMRPGQPHANMRTLKPTACKEKKLRKKIKFKKKGNPSRPAARASSATAHPRLQIRAARGPPPPDSGGRKLRRRPRRRPLPPPDPGGRMPTTRVAARIATDRSRRRRGRPEVSKAARSPDPLPSRKFRARTPMPHAHSQDPPPPLHAGRRRSRSRSLGGGSGPLEGGTAGSTAR